MKLLAIAFAIALSTSPSLAQSESQSEAGQQAAPQQKQSAAPEGSNLTNETPAPTSRQKPKRIDSAAPQQQTYSGVRARRSPNVASPDTSYNTIIKGIPPSNGTTKLPGPAGTLGTANANQPQGTTTQATRQVLPSRNGTSTNAAGRARAVRTDSNAAVQGAADQTNLPESMRIQQQTDRANPPGPDLITKGGASPAPSSSTGDTPVERSQLDPSAPSRDRLQIDDLSAVRPQNPGASAASVGSAPTTSSNNGASSGKSGTGFSDAPLTGSRSNLSTTPSRAMSTPSAGSSASH